MLIPTFSLQRFLFPELIDVLDQISKLGSLWDNTSEKNTSLAVQAKARHAAAWTQALVAQDVETLWPLWCRVAEHALGLPIGCRGSLLLARRHQVLPAPDQEAVEAAKQQATVTDLKRRLTCHHKLVHNVEASSQEDLRVDSWDHSDMDPYTAQVELEAWSKLWRPGVVRLRSVVMDDPSAWSASTIDCQHHQALQCWQSARR
eukprot:6484941-Amphidinium_carterae.4